MKTVHVLPKNIKNRALQVQSRLQEIGASVQNDFVEMGHLILEAEENKLWEHLENSSGQAYKSLRQWLLDAIPYSKSYAYLARKAMIGLKGVPEARLKEIPMVNMKQLIKLPETQRKNPKWVKDAVDLPEKEFSKKVNLVVMPNREEVSHVTFVLSDSLSRALAQSDKELNGTGTRQQSMDHMCDVFLELRKLQITVARKRGRPAKSFSKAA
jgi:hypothetical protein